MQYTTHFLHSGKNKSEKPLIDKLLLERLALAAMAANVRQSKVLPNAKDHCSYPQKPGSLTIQLDEMWSFVGSQENKQWFWLAIDTRSREIVVVFIGDRSRQSAKQLWQSLPAVYCQCAVCYTDFWEAYEQVLPSKRHRAVGKDTGTTNYIEQSYCCDLVLYTLLQCLCSFLTITIQHYQNLKFLG